MEKENIIIGVIGILVLLAIFNNFNFSLFSAIGSGNKITISSLNYNTFSASPSGYASIGTTGENIYFGLTDPTPNGAKENLYCEKVNSIIGEGTCAYQGANEFTGDFKTRAYRLTQQYLGNQFVVLNGVYTDNYNNNLNIKTYGICNWTSCYVKDLYPNEEIAFHSNPSYVSGVTNVIDMTINFREGGYTEQSGKSAFGFDTCEELWSCSDWSECTNNTQTKVCTDLNECGTVLNKPETFQSCSENETEFYGCYFTEDNCKISLFTELPEICPTETECESNQISLNQTIYKCWILKDNSCLKVSFLDPQTTCLSESQCEDKIVKENWLDKVYFKIGTFEVDGLILFVSIAIILILIILAKK